jgi:hypothetical protein
MRKILFLVLIGVGAVVVALCGHYCEFNQPEGIFLIKREDSLVCGLKDGSRFFLRARYRWDPVAELIPADVTTRYGYGYIVEFHPHKGAIYNLPGTYDYYQGMWKSDTTLCLGAFVAGEIVYGWGQYFSRSTGAPIPLPDPPVSFQTLQDAVHPHTVSFEHTNSTQELVPISQAASASASRIVYELSMAESSSYCKTAETKYKCPILAVYKTISLDNGKTWSESVVTTRAEIFELGKSIEGQSFVGHPLSINGKSIKRLVFDEKQKAEREERNRLAYIQEVKLERERYSRSLESAIITGDWSKFQKLLGDGVNIDRPYQSHFPHDAKAPLLVALEKPEYSAYALELIKHGTKLNPDGLPKGVTVLMLAAGYSSPEVIDALLVRERFDLNQPNPNGDTALSYAVASGQEENVRHLLELGADPHVITHEGTLVEIARQQGHTRIMQLLESHMR